MIPHLSIVIPVYNEADRLEKTLVDIDIHLKQKSYIYEIIVVNDGSTDQTSMVLKNLRIKNLHVIDHSINQGKGGAVKTGILSAKGPYRLFMDVDGSTSIIEIDRFLPFIENNYDIVVGSRIIPGSVKKIKQNPVREFLGWVYRTLVHLLFNIEVKDTQNGFRLFSKEAAEKIFDSLQIKDWGFDIEVLLLAKKMNYSVKEVPITWVNDRRSRINFLHTLNYKTPQLHHFPPTQNRHSHL